MPSRDPRPDTAGTAEQRLQTATIGPLTPLSAPIHLVAYDPAWPALFALEARRLRAILGDHARLTEHAGSTAVPGLAAKPIIDIVLGVPDSADEASYAPQLEAAGYVLRIREPNWFEHRLFKGPDTDINLHVFSEGCEEIERMLRFRDHLRQHDDDRRLYEATKRALAQRSWTYVQEYADAKSAVVREILARAISTDGSSQHGS